MTMMVSSRLWVMFCVPLSLAIGNQAMVEHTFNDVPVGGSPPGFTFASMRQKEPGRWTVQKREADTVLFHERDALTGYSLAIAGAKSPSDLVATVRVRFIDGARAGGLVWRYVDDQHYYALILDMAKHDISLVRVSGGNRILLEHEDDLELDPQAWHSLKVVHAEQVIRVMLGGVRVFEDNDRRNRWTSGPSGVGLIATGNSGVEFDDLRITPRTTHP
jgi:hypothetical protein